MLCKLEIARKADKESVNMEYSLLELQFLIASYMAIISAKNTEVWLGRTKVQITLSSVVTAKDVVFSVLDLSVNINLVCWHWFDIPWNNKLYCKTNVSSFPHLDKIRSIELGMEWPWGMGYFVIF